MAIRFNGNNVSMGFEQPINPITKHKIMKRIRLIYQKNIQNGGNEGIILDTMRIIMKKHQPDNRFKLSIGLNRKSSHFMLVVKCN